MKVAIIGGTGFVGSYLQDELLARGHHPVLLVRSGSESKVNDPERCTMVQGDVLDTETVAKTVAGCDAAIYCVGILREQPNQGITFNGLQYEGAVRTMDAAVQAGVKRFLLMSANGVKPDGTPYQRTKYQAEQYLLGTSLEWTVFRPSVIYGEPRGRTEFCTELCAQLLRPPLPAPLFYEGLLPVGAGRFAMSPVHVKDVATLFVKSLDMPETAGKVFPLCGPDNLEWRTILRTLGRASGRQTLAVPAPVSIIKVAASFLEGFAFFPVTRDQLTMLMEGNTGDSSEVFDSFGVDPMRFGDDSLSYLRGT